MRKNVILVALFIFILAMGVASASKLEFTHSKDGVLFDKAINIDKIKVEKYYDKIKISSTEHTETIIKVKVEDIKALGEFDGALRVTHYNDDGVQDWSNVIYPEDNSGYFDIPVEFSTVNVSIERTRLINWDMESWTGATINNWTVVGTSTCQKSEIKATGSYSALVNGIDVEGSIQQSVTVSPSTAMDLYASVYTTHSAAVQCIFYNSGGTQVGSSTTQSTTTGAWEVLSKNITVPSTAATMTVRLISSQPGEDTYFDAVGLTQSTNTVSATESYGGGWANTTFQYYKYSHYTMVAYQFSEIERMGALGNYTVSIDGTPTTDVYYLNDQYWIWNDMSASTWHTININQSYSSEILMLTPTNGSTISREFPPLYDDVTFTWTDTGTICQIQVAEDTAFSNIIYDHETTSATATVSLPEGTFYWRVRAYDEVAGEYNSFPSSYYLTIVTSASSVSGTGVHGVVYESQGIGNYRAISGALVTLYNDTFSITKTTGSDGYYQCLGLTNGTYYVIAQADDYKDSNIAAVNVTNSSVMIQNIAIQPENSYFAPHDVKFTFYEHWYSIVPMSDVSYNIYEDSNTVALKSGTTDDTGSFAVEDVSQSIKYRIVATHTENGVTRTLTSYIYPIDSSYRLLFSQSEAADTEGFAENVNITISKAAINTTAANITIAWNDSTGNLSSVTSSLLYNNTTIETSINGNSTGQTTFIAYNYTGKSYLIENTFDHQDFGTVIRRFSVTFGGSNIPFAGSILLGYLAVFILLIVATQFGKLEHATGSIAFVALAWVFFFIGMFDGFNKNTAIELGLTVATLYAIMVYMISRKEGGA